VSRPDVCGRFADHPAIVSPLPQFAELAKTQGNTFCWSVIQPKTADFALSEFPRQNWCFNLGLDAMTAPSQLVALARKAAVAQSLDPALVCAVIEQESAWNTWAMRYEPSFFAKYVAHLYTNNKITSSEAYARGFSWGLMQVMGQVARETGYDATFLSALCDPEQGLAIGCKLLRKKLDAMDGDTTRGLLAWNGGANPAYPAQVLARRAQYL
jgi:soluble lytic murein transglycosylase-like protein